MWMQGQSRMKMYASSPGQQLFKFIRTEQSFYKRRRFNSHRTGVEHQRGRLFICWDTNIAAVRHVKTLSCGGILETEGQLF